MCALLISRPFADHVISNDVGRRESNPGKVRLCLGGPTAVHDATRAAQAFAAGSDLDETGASRLCIIVEELVTNLYEYGGLGTDDVVELTLTRTAIGVGVMLIDPGKYFDPRLAAIDTAPPERGGGAGLKFLRSWAGEIDYRVVDGRNRLTLLIPDCPQESIRPKR